MISHLSWLLTALALLLFMVSIPWGAKRRLPPGPKGIPLLGSVLSLPSTFQEKTFTDWGNSYGMSIFHLRATKAQPFNVS